jgi:hypothetical protein
LGAGSAQDLQFWTPDELFGFLAQGFQRLPFFYGFDTIITGAAVVAFREQVTGILAVYFDGAALRVGTVSQFEAESDVWATRVGTPKRYTQTDQGLASIRLYPAPSSPKSLTIVYRLFGDVIYSDQFSAALIFVDAAAWRVIQLARSKESDAAMPEAAEMAGQLFELYRQMMESYWG